MDVVQRVGARITAMRRERQITQGSLAEKMGVAPQYVSALERGQVNITLRNLERVAHGLGVDIIALFCFDSKDFRFSKNSLKKVLDAATPEQVGKLLRLFAIVAEDSIIK